MNNNNISGGGAYDYTGLARKVGKWSELFDSMLFCSSVKYTGDYENGVKVGYWNILVKNLY